VADSPNQPKAQPTAAYRAERTEEDVIDAQLVAAIRSGDPDAWPRLIERYQVRIFSICMRMVRNRDLASDLTQDAFIKIIKGLDSFDDRAKLSTWVYRVTVNVCLSKLRSEKLRRHASLDAMGSSSRDDGDRKSDPGFAQSREPMADMGIERDEQRQQMLDALDALSDQHRAILILRDGRGLEYEHIAQVLDIPVGTVRSRLFRARASLRKEVEKRLRRSDINSQ